MGGISSIVPPCMSIIIEVDQAVFIRDTNFEKLERDEPVIRGAQNISFVSNQVL